MASSKLPQGFLFLKRYSVFEVVLFAALVGLIVILAAKREEKQWVTKLIHEMDLPQVQLAPEANPSANPYTKEYNFTSDWFTRHIPSWKEALKPFVGKPNIHYLEVGVYEGRATMWVVENILTDPSSRLTGLDIFVDEYEGGGPYKDRYLSNLELSGAADRATTVEGYSQVELRKLPIDSYDIIYIDGSHENPDVFEDAVLCWRLLKSGAVLIFDDYRSGEAAPTKGIDNFMRFFGSHFQVIHNGYQLMLQKR